MKGYCDICSTEIEIQICCNSYECGCQGLPVNPPVCSNDCYDKYMQKLKDQALNDNKNDRILDIF